MADLTYCVILFLQLVMFMLSSAHKCSCHHFELQQRTF